MPPIVTLERVDGEAVIVKGKFGSLIFFSKLVELTFGEMDLKRPLYMLLAVYSPMLKGIMEYSLGELS